MTGHNGCEAYFARVWFLEAGDDVEEGCFTGAVSSDERSNLTARHV